MLLKVEDAKYMDSKIGIVKTWLLEFWEQTDDMEIEGVMI